MENLSVDVFSLIKSKITQLLKSDEMLESGKHYYKIGLIVLDSEIAYTQRFLGTGKDSVCIKIKDSEIIELTREQASELWNILENKKIRERARN